MVDCNRLHHRCGVHLHDIRLSGDGGARGCKERLEMSEYIKREDVIEAIGFPLKNATRSAYGIVYPLCEFIARKVDEVPTADVVERKVGHWETKEVDVEMLDGVPTKLIVAQCSNCGHNSDYRTPFCWNCGADMRGDT